MASYVSHGATPPGSFVCLQRPLTSNCSGITILLGGVVCPQVCRHSTALNFSFTDIPMGTPPPTHVAQHPRSVQMLDERVL